MDHLTPIVDHIRTELETRSDARDQAIRRSRELIRHCANSIRAMYRGEFAQAQDLLKTARQAAVVMVDDVTAHPSVYGARQYHFQNWKSGLWQATSIVISSV